MKAQSLSYLLMYFIFSYGLVITEGGHVFLFFLIAVYLYWKKIQFGHWPVFVVLQFYRMSVLQYYITLEKRSVETKYNIGSRFTKYNNMENEIIYVHRFM